MIKKARDIQLGDKIGGRTVVILSHRDVKSTCPDESTDEVRLTEVRLIFADTIGRMHDDFCFVLGDTDVWVDDPEPCCNLHHPLPVTDRALGFTISGRMIDGFSFSVRNVSWFSVGGDDCIDLTKLSEALG